MVPNIEFHILTIHFEPPKRGQPLYKGQDDWSRWCPIYNGGSTVCIKGQPIYKYDIRVLYL